MNKLVQLLDQTISGPILVHRKLLAYHHTQRTGDYRDG